MQCHCRLLLSSYAVLKGLGNPVLMDTPHASHQCVAPRTESGASWLAAALSSGAYVSLQRGEFRDRRAGDPFADRGDGMVARTLRDCAGAAAERGGLCGMPGQWQRAQLQRYFEY